METRRSVGHLERCVWEGRSDDDAVFLSGKIRPPGGMSPPPTRAGRCPTGQPQGHPSAAYSDEPFRSACIEAGLEEIPSRPQAAVPPTGLVVQRDACHAYLQGQGPLPEPPSYYVKPPTAGAGNGPPKADGMSTQAIRDTPVPHGTRDEQQLKSGERDPDRADDFHSISPIKSEAMSDWQDPQESDSEGAALAQTLPVLPATQRATGPQASQAAFALHCFMQARQFLRQAFLSSSG